MKSMYSRLLSLVVLTIAISCSMLKKDRNTEVQDFLKDFASDLNAPDSVILSKFNTDQSNDALIAGIRVLQNNGIQPVKCEALFGSGVITFENEGAKVTIPIVLTVDSLPDRRVDDSLVLWLDKKDGKFLISKFQGESFYNQYVMLSNSVEFEINQHAILEERLVYYNKAKELQKTYDSVIWYATYSGKPYFYVIKGNWANYFMNDSEAKASGNFSMGLVDETGKLIVPVEYDLVGTIGMGDQNLVEVRKNGLVGYYHIESGKNIIPVNYKWIMPYSNANEMALVKKDTVYGWIDKGYQYHSGFPDKNAQRYVLNFEFLDDVTIDETSQSMCEIPNSQYAAYGIVMPPSYMTSFGLFKEIMGGFTIGEVQNMGYREYVKTESNFFENVAYQINTLITTVTERYLEGREEFYTHKEIAFLNNKRENIGGGDLSSSGEVKFKKIDSTLLEVKVFQTEGDIGPDGEAESFYFKYFNIDQNGNVTPVESNRSYVLTEKVKMDSTYLPTNLMSEDSPADGVPIGDDFEILTIKSMRNEILASYGYKFEDQETFQTFQYNKWYEPKYSSYAQFSDKMTEIDKHNLLFLEKIVGTLDPSYSASL